jgi:hypothetical protein
MMTIHDELTRVLVTQHQKDLERAAATHRLARLARRGRWASEDEATRPRASVALLAPATPDHTRPAQTAA